MTTADVRQWASQEGIPVPARGKVPASVQAQYDAAHPGDSADDSRETFVPTEGAGSPPGDVQESRPRTVATPRKITQWGKKTRSTGKKKASHPRVPVDKLISGGWGVLANFASPLPPTSRLLRMQAPVAGIILEDTVKGTVVDKFLQPVARAEAKGKAVFALVGPPMLVTAMQLQPDAQLVLLPVLRESLLVWCEIAGPRMEEAMKRESEFEKQHGQTVDQMIEMLFAPPPGADVTYAEHVEEGVAA